MSSVKYSAIAQNTYKFVNEVTIGNIGDVQDPKSPKIGCFKVISKNNTYQAKVAYYTARPTIYTSSSDETVNLKVYSNYVTSSTNSYDAVGRLISTNSQYIPNLFPSLPQSYKCVIDGEEYYGTKACPFLVHIVSLGHTTTNKEYLSWDCGETVLPACNLNVVKYDAATSTLIAQTHSLDEFVDSPEYKSSSSSSYMCWGRIIVLNVPKADEDIIIALTVEYPKYDITINNSANGMQYSIDDGITYQDITSDLQLSQIEHVMIKNTDVNNHTIALDDENVITITSGCVYVATPKTNATWTIA